MRFTREQLNKAARERMSGGDEPMRVLPAPEGTEVMEVRPGEYRLVEHIPARQEVTQLREPGPGPWRLYVTDDWDSDFQGSGGSQFDSYAEAERAAKAINPGYRSYVDNAAGMNVLKVVHHPETSHCPW